MASTRVDLHWTVGGASIEDTLQEMSRRGDAGVFMHMDTPHLPPERRPGAAYDRVLRKGWEVAIDLLPRAVIGKRAGREQFWFLLDGDRDHAEAQARALMTALQNDADLAALVWRIVLSPVTVPWNNAVILAEWLARDEPSPVSTEHNSIFWIKGDWRHTDRAQIDIVAENGAEYHLTTHEHAIFD